MSTKKEMRKGLILFISFFLVFAAMWAPWYGKDDAGKGLNAFMAADNLFNSISKGSSYFVDKLTQDNASFTGKTDLDMSIEISEESMLPMLDTVLSQHLQEMQISENKISFKGDLVSLVDEILTDSEALYNNNAQKIMTRYDIKQDDTRAVGYAWYLFLKAMEDKLNNQGDFAQAKHVKEVINRGVEVGYNFYGIEAEQATSKAGILSFSLIFYVVYTLWYGMAIFYLFEGMGLKMTKGKKKEV
ncbi:MAG: hypothetical protein LC631_02680 [Desulfovibrionales bacterium]|nr:hypothetical protein [Desulfovibrionales bacterium]